MKKDLLLRNFIVMALFFLTFWFGIRPIITGEEFENRLKKANGPTDKNEFSLVVFGTEPEGIAAALAGARMGLKTLLVTEDIDPGSYIKSGLITYTSPDYATLSGNKKKLNEGIYTEIFGDTGANFAPSDYITSVQALMKKESNLTVLYDAGFLSVQTNGNMLKSVTLYHGGEKRTIQSPVFIDATEHGTILTLCEVPFFLGSGDITVPDTYMPVSYNFIISNVNWEDIESIRKQNKHMDDLQSVLLQYERYSPKTRISNLSFIGQPDDDIVISGIRMHNVNPDDPEGMKADFETALVEAKRLTTFLQFAFVPFENATLRTGPSKFYIPEYRHFEGRYQLRVADILDNRDFPTKLVLASAPVDAEKFISAELAQEYSYILGKPEVYSIPLECFISKNYDNLLMVGKKASYSSLAATSAGRLPVSITSGEALGVTAAYCYLNELTPAELVNSAEKTQNDFQKLLKRAGIILTDIDAANPNAEHWAWPSVKVLTEYGLVAGGVNNDYLFDLEAYPDNLSVLIINLIVKAAPQQYSLELDTRVRAYHKQEQLTGEIASEILLCAMDIPYERGKALDIAKKNNLIPPVLSDTLRANTLLTMDEVYTLTVHLVENMQ